MNLTLRRVCGLAAALLLLPSLVVAQKAAPREPSLTVVDGLGALSFPNSGSPEAQTPFLRGVLLLHSFEFEPAAAEFRKAQQADPGFALAYWGEAMTHNHPLWRQQDRTAALAILGRLGQTPEARATKAGTHRERQYLEAVEILYSSGPKGERDQAYMGAMARLQQTYPEDMEARSFHALAILGSRNGTRDFATYMRAAATAQPVFDANPQHPGAAHYLIHSFDDPVHAVLGLKVARIYGEVAPGAAHAQHMTSHIFVALGMWDDVVAANIRARDTQNAATAAAGRKPNVCGHYTSWLQYGHLMRGEVAAAAAILDSCHARMSDNATAAERSYFASMRARQLLDTGDWSLASRWTWTPPVGDPARLDYLFGNAFAALRQGDTAPARTIVNGPVPTDDQAKLHVQELRGLLALASGRVDEGVKILREAADQEDGMPFEFGPPAILKPTHELLGEELLTLGRTAEAQAAFARAAERTPGRLQVVQGQARSSRR
jgi:hypothetical protein